LEKHSEVKKVRLDTRAHKVNVGFYETPSDELLARIKTAVRNELAGEWDVSIEPAGASPLFHLHKIDSDTAEFHRKHPADEPRLIWKRIPLPAWRTAATGSNGLKR
jgi:hypothetical protein